MLRLGPCAACLETLHRASRRLSRALPSLLLGLGICAQLRFATTGIASSSEPAAAERQPPTVAAAYATPRPCRPTAKKQWISVRLAPPKQEQVTAVTVLVDYPDGMLSIPSKKNDEKVKSRIGRLPANAIIGVNDLDTALRVVLAKPGKLPPGELFTVEFDRCDGADRATAEDFRCTVEAAANSSGSVEGVTCAVVVP